MSDAFTDIAQEERDKFNYLAAVSTISTYIVIGAKKHPSGFIREKYLKLAYEEVARGIKNEVEDMIGVIDA
jgi:hypothetical protein